jgi:hypothetical protein
MKLKQNNFERFATKILGFELFSSQARNIEKIASYRILSAIFFYGCEQLDRMSHKCSDGGTYRLREHS